MRTTLLIAALSACVAISPLPAPGQVVASASPLLQKAEKKSPGADSGARSLKEVLQEFKKHYAIDILFFNSMVEGVEIPAKDIRLEDNPEKSLRALLQNSGLTYKKSKNGGYVIVARKRREDAVLRQSGEKTIGNFPVSREINPVQPVTPDTEIQSPPIIEKTVRGKVTDEQGEVLPGVSILVKGTQLGGITDENGNYQLAVRNDEAVLIFSFVGYISQEIKIGTQTKIDVLLKTDEKALEEVVVVGYGTQKKTSMTAAVSSMKGEEIASVPTTNLSNNLGGRLSGVIVKQGSGEPGRDGSSIFIRGISTTGANQPLLIVDGIPRSFQQLDPNSIETFTVLKDAAAVAPYGVAGANGVVLVTTKRGQTGKPTITYNGYVGFQNPVALPKYVSPSQYAELKNIIAESEGLPKPYSEEVIQKYKDGSDPDAYPSEKILDVIVNRNARLVYHNLEISGGADRINYYAGIGYQSQEGMWANSNARRFNLVMNVDAKVTNSTTLSLKLNGVLRNANRPPSDQPSNSTGRIMETIGYAHIGNTFGGPSRFSNGMYGYHVMANIYGSGYQKENGTNIYSQLSLEQKINSIPGLSLKGTIAYDPGFGTTKTWTTPVRVGIINRGVTPYVISESTIGTPKPSLTEQWNRQNQMTYQAGVDYTNSFGKNTISAIGVFEAKSNFFASVDASRRNYNIYLDEINMGSSSVADMTTGGTSSEARQVGLVYRVAYERNGKYLFEASGRYDGHYYFAPENRFGFFPAFSAGWRISEEDFVKNSGLKWLSNLKLRTSYGEVGALAGSGFQYLSTYGVSGPGYKLGGNAVQIVSERAEPNPNITWERAKKTDIGLELGIMNNQINLEVDYFHEKRSNMLVAPDVITPLEYGIGLSQVNAGVMANKGIDLAAGLNYRINKDLLIQFNSTFTYAKNKLLQTFENTVTYNNPNRRRTGRPLGTQFGYNSLGFFLPEDFESDGSLKPGIAVQPWGAVRPGDIRYEDVNGDGRIDSNDEVAIGAPNQSPRIVYGFSPSLQYKNWNLDMLFQGAAKTHLFHVGEMAWAFFNGMNAYEENLDYWRPDNRDAKHPRLTGAPTTNNTQMSPFWVRNAAYLRLKNVTLSYHIPNRITTKVGVTNARIYASGQNILTWSKMVYWDPESTFRSYPQQKVISFGISLSL